jgi:hypothetical protein
MDSEKKNLIKTFSFLIEELEDKTEVALSLFTNQLLVVISQLGKFGSIVT